MNARSLVLNGTFAFSMLIGLTACSDKVSPAPIVTRESVPTASFTSSCVATVRMITQESDSLDAVYSWIPQSDTIDICETWMNGDYRWEFVTVGTSERESGVYDMARDAYYDAGTVTVMQQGAAVSSTPVGATIFATFNADPTLVQASYDDPYYGIRALGGDIGGDPGGGACTTCFFSRAPASTATQAPVLSDTLYRRHGIHRRGVRAVVESMKDAGLTREGYRRFSRMAADGEHVILIHPALELVMGEALIANDGDIVSRTTWKRAPGGFVRDVTVVETRDHVTHKLIDRTTISFKNVKVSEPQPQVRGGGR